MNKLILQRIVIGILSIIAVYVCYCSCILITEPITINQERTGVITYKYTMLSTGKYTRQRNMLVPFLV